MDGAGRTGEIVDLVHLDKERKGYVVAKEFEFRIPQQMQHILPSSGEEVVDAENVVAVVQKPFAQVRTQETGSAGY
jgi:hypothetical protein